MLSWDCWSDTTVNLVLLKAQCATLREHPEHSADRCAMFLLLRLRIQWMRQTDDINGIPLKCRKELRQSETLRNSEPHSKRCKAKHPARTLEAIASIYLPHGLNLYLGYPINPTLESGGISWRSRTFQMLVRWNPTGSIPFATVRLKKRALVQWWFEYRGWDRSGRHTNDLLFDARHEQRR